MRHPEGVFPAGFFDGRSASRHPVGVRVAWQTPARLEISGPAGVGDLSWPLDELRALSDQADRSRLVLTRLAASGDETPHDPARLVVEDEALRDWILASRPSLFRKELPKGAALGVVKKSALAIAAFLAILFVILPRMADTLAGLIPLEREIALGRATVRQIELVFGGDEPLRCENPEAQRLLDAMGRRLAASPEIADNLTILVLDHPMVNAFAAPGGHIVFFRGMIEAARTPDELVGVLAHEIGHLEARDPTRLALRSAGTVGVLGLVLGDFAGGGLVLVLVEQLIDASYSQEAESRADAYAFSALAAQDVDPAALGDLFERLGEAYGDTDGVIAHFLSHPSLGERVAQAREAGRGMTGTAPSLTSGEFAIVKGFCG